MRPRPACLLLALVALAGCGGRVPETPVAARAQPPQAGAPIAWRGRGRLAVRAPGHRLDAEFVVRATPGEGDVPAEVRLVLLADAGVRLADVSLGPAGAVIHHAVPDLRGRAEDLARLLDPWLPARPAAATWDGGRLVERAGKRRRRYGGDPLLLRRVDGDGWPLAVADWRPLAGALLAREIVADGPWSAELRLRLVDAQPLAATASSPP